MADSQPSVLYQPPPPSVEQSALIYQPPASAQASQVEQAVLYQQAVVEPQVLYQPQPPAEPQYQEPVLPPVLPSVMAPVLPSVMQPVMQPVMPPVMPPAMPTPVYQNMELQPEAVVGGQYIQEPVDPLARKILEMQSSVTAVEAEVAQSTPPVQPPVEMSGLSPSGVVSSQPELEPGSREKVSSGVLTSQLSVPAPSQLPFIRLESSSRTTRRGSLPVAQPGSLLPLPLPASKAHSAESSPKRVSALPLNTYTSLAHKLPFPSQSLRRRSADPSELLCYRTSSSSPEELMVPLTALEQRRASGGSSLVLSPVWEQAGTNMMTIREVISLCGSTTSLASTQVGSFKTLQAAPSSSLGLPELPLTLTPLTPLLPQWFPSYLQLSYNLMIDNNISCNDIDNQHVLLSSSNCTGAGRCLSHYLYFASLHVGTLGLLSCLFELT